MTQKQLDLLTHVFDNYTMTMADPIKEQLPISPNLAAQFKIQKEQASALLVAITVQVDEQECE